MGLAKRFSQINLPKLRYGGEAARGSEIEIWGLRGSWVVGREVFNVPVETKEFPNMRSVFRSLQIHTCLFKLFHHTKGKLGPGEKGVAPESSMGIED